MKFLENDSIRLRAVEPDDAESLWEAETDSRQWIDNGMSAPLSLRNLKEYAENYDADPIRSGQLRMICENKEGAMVGIVDLYDISATGRTAFVGIYIFERFRNNGYAAECISLLEFYAHMLLNLRILGAKIAETNVQSIHLFEQAGYELRGNLPGWLLSGNKSRSLLIYTKQL